PPDLPSFPTRRSSDLARPLMTALQVREFTQPQRRVEESHPGGPPQGHQRAEQEQGGPLPTGAAQPPEGPGAGQAGADGPPGDARSEEHTSELQSPYDL